ncbi:MAG TPA: DsrE family protein [Thioalkalivibrio sp.]|nr:DsrE family protein [Thioalkalivibrio sp.]
MRTFTALFCLALLPVLALPQAWAETPDASAIPRVALQISDHDPIRQTMVLSVATNLVNHYGIGEVDVEIVAFGPGLNLLRRPSPFGERITELAAEKGVRFTYCQITVDSTEQREGQRMFLVPEATSTPSGAVRIVDLVGQGYVHIAP